MRLAWFSPMPPVPSGIAVCSADLVAALAGDHEIDVYVDDPVAKVAWHTRSAHEFVWRHRRRPYDLTVYQLGNSSHHDYQWPYLFRYPGLVVLHDAHLHHARAAALLRSKRADDYRAEFAANHPETQPDMAELAIAGYDSHLYYSWPMTRLVVQRSRVAAVHSPVIAADLRAGVVGIKASDTPQFRRPIELQAMGFPVAGYVRLSRIDFALGFTLYLVWTMPAGQGPLGGPAGTNIIYTLASYNWSVAFLADRNPGAAGQGVNQIDATSGVYVGSGFTVTDANPTKLVGPTANASATLA